MSLSIYLFGWPLSPTRVECAHMGLAIEFDDGDWTGSFFHIVSSDAGPMVEVCQEPDLSGRGFSVPVRQDIASADWGSVTTAVATTPATGTGYWFSRDWTVNALKKLEAMGLFSEDERIKALEQMTRNLCDAPEVG